MEIKQRLENIEKIIQSILDSSRSSEMVQLKSEFLQLKDFLLPKIIVNPSNFNQTIFSSEQIEKLSLILKNLRYRLSIENQMPVWKIFNNNELEKILSSCPRNKEEFFSKYNGSKYSYEIFGKYLVNEINDFNILENNLYHTFTDDILSKIDFLGNETYTEDNIYSKLTNYRDIDETTGFSRKGYFQSEKVNRYIPYESELERKFMAILENSSKVKYYMSQPISIRHSAFYKVGKINKGYMKKSYIPDFIVIFTDGTRCLVEVKNYYDFCSVKNKVKNEVLKKYCKEKNFGYLTTTNCKSTLEEAIKYEISPDFLNEFKTFWEENNSLSVKTYLELRRKYSNDNHWILPTCYQLDLYVEENQFHRIEDLKIEIFNTGYSI